MQSELCFFFLEKKEGTIRIFMVNSELIYEYGEDSKLIL